jgi:hypothetical protein
VNVPSWPVAAVASSAENNTEISAQHIEIDIVREELLDEDDGT